MNVRTVRRWTLYVTLLLILGAASFAVGNLVTERAPARAQAPSSGDIAAPEGFGNCLIVELAQLSNRMHVKCQANSGGIGSTIIFFAAPTQSPSEVREANRFMSLLMVAWAFGRQPTISWDDSTTQNPPGCLTTDCRRLRSVTMQ